MGAQGCVLTPDNQVLLVRHTYRPGWHFPGGGVEKNETIETALRRELEEEAGILIEGRAALFGIFSHHTQFPGDHIALYVIRNWRQPRVPPPSREIAEQGFFSPARLPDGTQASTAARVNEIIEGRQPAEVW
jgi:8-oxo-dGTP pyrophosphatase MutT (NUDIX family)